MLAWLLLSTVLRFLWMQPRASPLLHEPGWMRGWSVDVRIMVASGRSPALFGSAACDLLTPSLRRHPVHRHKLMPSGKCVHLLLEGPLLDRAPPYGPLLWTWTRWTKAALSECSTTKVCQPARCWRFPSARCQASATILLQGGSRSCHYLYVCSCHGLPVCSALLPPDHCTRTLPVPLGPLPPPQVLMRLPGAACWRHVTAGPADPWVWVTDRLEASAPVRAPASCLCLCQQSLGRTACSPMPCDRRYLSVWATTGCILGTRISLATMGWTWSQPDCPAHPAAWLPFNRRPHSLLSMPLGLCWFSSSRQPLEIMARNRGRRGQGSGRRRRPRDTERERARPTRSDCVRMLPTVSVRFRSLLRPLDEAMVPAQPLPRRSAGRPLTVFTQHLDGDSSPGDPLLGL